MSEEFRPVYTPRPYSPDWESAWLKPKESMDPRKVQEEVQQVLRRLALLVGRVPGQQVTLTDEFLVRLFVEGPRLRITSDPMRQVVVLAVHGGELLQGTVIESS